jgi:hypothetical protein
MDPIVGIATFVAKLVLWKTDHAWRSRPRRELIMLLNLQLATLEKEVFGVVRDAERREYRRRHDRIHKLHSQLSGLRVLEMASEKIHFERVRRRKNSFTRAA